VRVVHQLTSCLISGIVTTDVHEKVTFCSTIIELYVELIPY
jgi:hypothetical protein